MDAIESIESGDTLPHACKVVGAAVSPNANHVLQRLVATLRPRDCQFFIDELLQDSGTLMGYKEGTNWDTYKKKATVQETQTLGSQGRRQGSARGRPCLS